MTRLKNDPDKRMENVVTFAGIAEGFPDGDFALLDRQHLPRWVEDLKKAEASTRRLRYRLESLLAEEEGRRCWACGGSVVGRKDRIYCGATCRKRGSRGPVAFSPGALRRSQIEE